MIMVRSDEGFIQEHGGMKILTSDRVKGAIGLKLLGVKDLTL